MVSRSIRELSATAARYRPQEYPRPPTGRQSVMTGFGYTLMGEGHDPRTLVRNAVLAEQAGLEHAVFSDGFLKFWCDGILPRL